MPLPNKGQPQGLPLHFGSGLSGLGDYLLEILAYTNESHEGKPISFEVILEGDQPVRSLESMRIDKVKAMDNQTGRYSPKVLYPLTQRHTLVRLSAGDYTETVVTPQVSMGQNYPNPMVMSGGKSGKYRSGASDITYIPVNLSRDTDVNVSIFNIKGQKVRTITEGNLTAGRHKLVWDGNNEQNRPVAAGIYFYRLQTPVQTINKKMLLIR